MFITIGIGTGIAIGKSNRQWSVHAIVIGMAFGIGLASAWYCGREVDWIFLCLELVLFLLFIRIKNKFFLNMCMNLFYCKIVFDFANFYTMK